MTPTETWRTITPSKTVLATLKIETKQYSYKKSFLIKSPYFQGNHRKYLQWGLPPPIFADVICEQSFIFLT